MAVTVAACGVYFGMRYYAMHQSAVAEFYYESTLVERITLHPGAAKTFQLAGHEAVTFALDETGAVRFESSDCPDQICVHAGWMRLPGQSAACLPNKLIVKVTPAKGQTQNTPDAVVG